MSLHTSAWTRRIPNTASYHRARPSTSCAVNPTWSMRSTWKMPPPSRPTATWDNAARALGAARRTPLRPETRCSPVSRSAIGGSRSQRTACSPALGRSQADASPARARARATHPRRAASRGGAWGRFGRRARLRARPCAHARARVIDRCRGPTHPRESVCGVGACSRAPESGRVAVAEGGRSATRRRSLALRSAEAAPSEAPTQAQRELQPHRPATRARTPQAFPVACGLVLGTS